jgi:esterase/lipase
MKALTLFAQPRKGRVESFQKKYLNQATQSEIIIDNLALKVYTFGSGPKRVLLIHGWESNSWRWRKLINFLGKDQFTFYAIDAPAHGYSAGKTFNMHTLMKGINQLYIDHRPEIIIGHSMGGMASLLHASHFKMNPLTKLICLASPHSLAYIFDLYYNAIGIGNRIKDNTAKYFQDIFGMELDYFDVTVHGVNIDYPLLIVHDINDNLNSIACARAVHNTVPKSTLETVDYSNHSLQSPKIFEIIKNWIDNNN